MSVTHLQHIFDKQRSAFYSAPFPSLTYRLDLLNRLHQLLITHQDEFVAVISRDFGHRARYETLFEIFSILEEIKYAKRHLKQWMKAKKHKVSIWYKFAYAKIMPQPLGVVGIIAAWNGPLILTLAPLIGILAAGNRAMIKTSELAPLTGDVLKETLGKYFSDEEVAFVTGDSHVGKAFASLPFDHLLFTGSSKIARSVLNSTSQHLTPVTLELGGKSPVIIAKDANLKSAVKKIIIAKLFNAGQVCLAPDYIFLPQGFEKEFINIAKKMVKKYYPKIITNPDYTNIINMPHMERLQIYLDDAKANGAEIIPLTEHDESEIRVGNKFMPVALLNTKPNMCIMQEEIFGPFLPIISYENITDVMGYINARPKPLGLYYFGWDKKEIDTLLAKTYSGGVSINAIALHFCQHNLPFGGVGASGMGHYHGEYGFNTFSKLKSIYYQHRLNFLPLFYPPYGRMINFLIKFMLR